MTQRRERVADQMRRELAAILQRELKDPRLGFASVTEVELSPDLRHARIYVSVLGDEQERKGTLIALERAAGFIRTELGQRIRLRYTPELIFKLDDSIERGVRINKLINELQAKENKEEQKT